MEQDVCYRVFSLEFELVNSQSLGVLQLLDLLHPLVVASGLLNDEHLYTPTGKERQYLYGIFCVFDVIKGKQTHPMVRIRKF